VSLQVVYAKALLGSIEGGKANPLQIKTELTAMRELLETSRDLRAALMSPSTSIKEKQSIISEISKKSGWSESFRHFLLLLAKKNRLSLSWDLEAAFDRVRIEAAGGILAELVSSSPVSTAELESLSKAFSEKFGKKTVEFRVSIDPAMIAGLRITINGVTYDGSLRAQVGALRRRLLAATH
jgi:F-type H+-transporting ATPase subunit delta